MRTASLALIVMAAASSVLAQDDYRHGRIRHVEGGTTLQRATEAGSEEAMRNLPFLPGDRIWTDERGRVEFQFGGASAVRLDSRSKLDYLDHEEQGADRVVLRLWSGAAFLRTRDGRDGAEFEIETPGGLVSARGRVALRIDVAYGEARLGVLEGEAVLDSGERRVTVGSGERSWAGRGQGPEQPQAFDRRELDDDFARWCEAREERDVLADNAPRDLPEEILPYAPELEQNGSWHVEVGVGTVWRPYVSPGWRPYFDGRWAWSPYGWTWVPNEPWGWAPSHYGRWGHSAALGWYWVPGSTWGPAWVSWSVGGDYVGWCPLGWRDRPVTVHERGHRGYAVPRGSAGGAASPPWVYARRDELGSRETARRRVDMGSPESHGFRVVDGARSRIDRSLRVVEGEAAVPRHVQTRPTPGDTIPELRSDPATTIPFPTARRRYPSEDERRERAAPGSSTGSSAGATRRWFGRGAAAEAPADSAQRRELAQAPQTRVPEVKVPDAAWSERRRSVPWSERSSASSADRERAAQQDTARERRRDGNAGAAPSALQERPQRERATPSAEPERAKSPDREVLRRLFGTLTERRGRDSGSESRPRDGASDSASSRQKPGQPREATPPPSVRSERPRPSGGDSGEGARRRRKEDQ